MKLLRTSLVSAALAILMAIPAAAQSRWIHVRATEHDDRRSSMTLNLPLRSTMAMTRAIAAARGQIDIHGLDIDIDTIGSGWLSLREKPAGEEISSSEHGSALVFTRTIEGMKVVSTDRWSGEKSEIEIIAPLLELLTAGDLADHALNAGLSAVPSGVRAFTAEDGDVTIVAWIDEWPNGALP